MRRNYSTQLLELINQLARHTASSEVLSPDISQKSVNWHIDHSLRVIIGICKTLILANPKTYSWKFNLKRTVIFSYGKIPRGKGRAPKVVMPNDVIKNEEIIERIAEANKMVNTIANLNKHCYFKHPLFGNLSLSKSQYFMVLHTKHHLHIIKDILAFGA
jgi:hypothetical protein